jgi:uncharacterized repeat protein (TIGR01451 family)
MPKPLGGLPIASSRAKFRPDINRSLWEKDDMKAYKSWGTIALLASAVLLVTILVSQPVRAAGPWYVAPTGSDGNTCLSAVSPCATINGALAKISPGDTVLVATGTYTGTGTEVVTLNISATLSGGWNSGFTTQTGMSTIDGQGARRGVTVNSGVTAILEYFVVRNGFLLNNGGDGIFNSGTVTLNNSTVSGNKNGVYNDHGTLALNNSTINGNTERGIINNLGSMTISNSTVSGNSTQLDSGGGIFNFGTMTISNTTISGNSAGNSGGSGGGGGSGIYSNGVLTLNNSTVSGNTILGDYPGSGINNVNGTLILNNSTVSGNSNQYGSGGGISNSGGTVTLRNSILAGNTTSGTGLDCSGSISSSGYNLIGSTSGCTFTPGAGDLINVAAKLGPLQDNGGSTLTQALLPSSPAINAGNWGGCMGSNGLLITDQRGKPRFGRCDIGAYELQPIGFSTKAINTSTGLPGQPLTYTIALTNGGASNIANILVTDTLPINLTYQSNSLIATDGTYGFDSGVITWTGSLNAGGLVTVTFGATVSQTASLGTSIVNTAIISGGGETFNRTATFNIDGQACNLTKYAGNPVLKVGANGAWDDAAIWRPIVLKEGSIYKMWYSASDGTTRRIGLATSPNGITWTKSISNPVLAPGSVGAWDSIGVYAPSVIFDGGVYKMWYAGNWGFSSIGYATSPDGITWTKSAYNPVLSGQGYYGNGYWEAEVTEPTVIKVGTTYHLWYVGNDGTILRIGHATSTDGLNWVKDAANPVLNLGTPGNWDWLDVYSPSVVKVGDEFKLWYSGDTLPPAYQTGYATSLDGSTWTRQQKLIAQGPLNSFDVHSADYPAVIVDNGGYKVWYSGLNSSGTYNLGYATAGICSANPPATIVSRVYLPIIIKSPSCQAYYTDNFSDPNSGWPISDDSNRRFAYINGEYQILVKNPAEAWLVTPGAKATDFTASVSARRTSGTSGAYGILFGLDGNDFEFYEVLIDANTYSIWHYIGLSWSPLQNWTSSPYIATGTNWNRLKVVRNGATISFYVNNHLLTTVSNSSTFRGTLIGMTAESDNTALDARFDDFSLYPASCGATAYSVTSNTPVFEMGKPEVRQLPLPPRLSQP